MQRIIKISFCLVAVLLVASISFAQSFTPEEIKQLEIRAQQGNAKAQYNLGILYRGGDGVEKNYRQAKKWFEKATEQGHAKAQFNLGILYRYGMGVKLDYRQAKEWFEKAAEQGHAEAQFNLGLFYHYNIGVKQDYVKAKEWYEKAAAQGNSKAEDNLINLRNKIKQIEAKLIKDTKTEEKSIEYKSESTDFDTWSGSLFWLMFIFLYGYLIVYIIKELLKPKKQ